MAWKKWDANKHLVYTVCQSVKPLAESKDARLAMQSAVATLSGAITLHASIRAGGLHLRDNTDAYQAAWAGAGNRLLVQNADDYDFLEMVGGP